MLRRREKTLLSNRRCVGGRRHGIPATYAHGCKCELCRAAHSAYLTAFRAAAKAARFIDADGNLCAPVPDHMHGKLGTYANHSCRCTRCQEARRAYHFRVYGPARQKLPPAELARLRRSVGVATDTTVGALVPTEEH